MSASIRDASLTTLRSKQSALWAYRQNSNFPSNNVARPEQPKAQTGDVPVNAKIGASLCPGCVGFQDYGPNGNAYVRSYKF
jgi:hypothetical protein